MTSMVLIDSATDTGSNTKANEDRIVLAEDLCVILDGATGIGRRYIGTHSSEAVWFVETIAVELVDAWRCRHDFVLALSKSIDACIDQYLAHVDGKEVADYERPSASMVAVVMENNVLNLFRLGDCMAYCKQGEGAARLFDKSPIEALDGVSIAAMSAGLTEGKSLGESREAILPLLRSHRSLMNKAGGYGVLSLSHDCLGFIECLSLPQPKGMQLLMVTDGFSAIERYKGYSAVEIFRDCATLGLGGVIEGIRVIEANDSDLGIYPRLKLHDDATAVLLSF